MTVRLPKWCLFEAKLAFVAMLLSSGCSEPAHGRVTFTTWGEDFIEQGIPREEFPQDHYSVKYSKFLVVYHAVTISDDDGAVVAGLEHPLVFDLTRKSLGRRLTLGSFELEAKNWRQVSYQLGPISKDARPGELATDDDVRLLQSEQASLHVEGLATAPSGKSKHFSWSFSPATLFSGCHAPQNGQEVEGVLVTSGGDQEVELTMHGDHLFYDDLQSSGAVMRFAALAAADSNGDDEVTLEELDRVPLYTLDPTLGSYGTGALGSVNTLGDFERTLAETTGHYRGEGSCNSRPLAP